MYDNLPICHASNCCHTNSNYPLGHDIFNKGIVGHIILEYSQYKSNHHLYVGITFDLIPASTVYVGATMTQACFKGSPQKTYQSFIEILDL